MTHYPKDAPRKAPLVKGCTGYRLTQVVRAGRVAIYRQDHDHGAVNYEVHKIGVVQCHPSGRDTGWCERLARDSRWGEEGWTYRHLEDAVKRFVSMLPASTESDPGKTVDAILQGGDTSTTGGGVKSPQGQRVEGEN